MAGTGLRAIMRSEETGRGTVSREKQIANLRKPSGISGMEGDSARLENLKVRGLGAPGLHQQRYLLNVNHAADVPYDGIGLWSGKTEVERM